MAEAATARPMGFIGILPLLAHMGLCQPYRVDENID